MDMSTMEEERMLDDIVQWLPSPGHAALIRRDVDGGAHILPGHWWWGGGEEAVGTHGRERGCGGGEG
jgi:hypothetical protein